MSCLASSSDAARGLVTVDPQDRHRLILSPRVVAVEERVDDWVVAVDAEGNWSGGSWQAEGCPQPFVLTTTGPTGVLCLSWVRYALLAAAHDQSVPVYGMEGLW